MARIQILELPMEEDATGKVVTPFAVIIDQCDAHLGITGSLEVNAFGKACGARTIWATTATVDIPSLTAEEVATINGAAIVSPVKDPCGAELCLDGSTLQCQRTFNHDGIHEVRVKDYSYLRWSYAGRRVLPLE